MKMARWRWRSSQQVSGARVMVTFLPAESEPAQHGEEDAEQARREAVERLMARMKQGIDFGGWKFNREELYHDDASR